MKRTPLRRISERRLLQNDYYLYLRRRFLEAHPYCQVWLQEHGFTEDDATRQSGVVEVAGVKVAVPLATQIHHAAKRRGADLLDESRWLAVSRESHERIESDKSWVRSRGYLQFF